MALNDRTRKILAVLLFVASVFGIGWALYFTFFRAPAAPAPTPETPVPTAVTPGTFPAGGTATPRITTNIPPAGLSGASAVAAGGPTLTTELTQAPVANVALSGSGNAVNYYDATDGRFYAINAAGNVQKLSDQVFPQVSSAAWNKSGDKAVLTFPDQSKIVYNFTSQSQVTLPSHWQDVAFSPTTDQIEAKSIALDPGNRWLVTSNADGSNVKAFAALGDKADKVTIAWSPNDQVVAFSDTADPQGSLDRKLILPIGKAGENLKGLTVEGMGFLPKWSPDGSQLLYSVAGDFSNSKPLLWLTGGTPATMDQNRRSLGLNTWADKCAYADAGTVYCAVPRDLPDNAGLQRALYRANPDQLFKVDIQSGRTSLVAAPVTDMAMENLTVSKDGTTLFFTDAVTSKLESMRLK